MTLAAFLTSASLDCGYRALHLAKFSTFLSKSLSPQLQAQSKTVKKRNSEAIIISLTTLSVFLPQKAGNRRDELPSIMYLETGKLPGRPTLTFLFQWSYSLPHLSYLFLNHIVDWVITNIQNPPISISSSRSLTASTCLHTYSLPALAAKLQQSFNILGSSSH